MSTAHATATDESSTSVPGLARLAQLWLVFESAIYHGVMAALEVRHGADLNGSIDEAVEQTHADAPTSTAGGLASGAVVLLVTLVVVSMGALVGGEFLNAIPSDSAFSGAIDTLTNNASTSFTIFGVALLAIPAVAVISYIVINMGGFMDLGGVSVMNRNR